MSALTDLFTSLATKIRSKTGGSDTYTPPQMVSAIDDVYQAGVDAGETTHTRTYTPAANTAANDMGVTHDYRYVNTSGMIVPSGAKSITANGTGIDVSAYATANVNVSGTSITPSNTSPASMSGGTLYTPSASGYAISSYDSVTPSSSGTYFSSGMKKMASSGYAYSSKPQMTETVLWTNSNPTGSVNTQTITCSESVTNFDEIVIEHATSTGTTESPKRLIYPSSVIRNFRNMNGYECGALGWYKGSNSSYYVRMIYMKSDSDTQITITGPQRVSASGTDYYALPILRVIGLKY